MNTQARKTTKTEDEGDEEDEIKITYEDDEPTKGEEEQDDKDQDDQEDDDQDDDGRDEDDEREQYSKRVQKRIDKLKYERHEERRRAEEAIRLREEAVNYAKVLTEREQQLRRQLTEGEGALYGQAEQRVQAQIEWAKVQLRQANESGDPDAIVEAQAKLSSAVADKARIESFKPRKSQPEQTPQAQPQIQQEQPRQQQRQEPSQRAREWASKNPWFEQNDRMRAVALAVHNEIIQDGVQPDTDEYYGQIDKEMRKTFPSYFGKSRNSAAPVVAAPTRNTGRKPREVRLSKSQQALCKRLGISPEDYARNALNLENKND